MAKINENYIKLPGSYLFSTIAKKVAAYSEQNPDANLIRLGIGDVTRPLPNAVVEAMVKASQEMADAGTFRGYGPEQGYDFLREAIAKHDFQSRGVDIAPDEIFVSDGSKSDTGNIGDIFSVNNKVAICDPVYPVYVDTNAMAGRAGEYGADGKWTNLVYMPCTKETDFMPQLPSERVDIIYLCFPNNPTGGAATREELQKWVNYAREQEAIILYDAAYEAYITEDLPHSIFEIEGAKECAIEFRSFSKNAGFTGTRCAFTVIPKTVMAKTEDGQSVSLHTLWNRRHTTKFNGVPYIIQRGAEAVYSPRGQAETKALVDYYLNNARIIRNGLESAGYEVSGGVNSPYVWLKTPGNMTSWEFFDALLEKVGVVGTPGSGFGPSGEGYFRLTGFGTEEKTIEAIERIRRAQL